MRHRTALVTAASVAAIVVAGGTAIAANLGILTTSTAPVGDLSVSSPVLGEAPPARVVTVGDGSAATSPASEDLAAFAVEDAGVVTLRRVGSQLVVEEVALNLGWRATVVGEGPVVEVVFSEGERLLGFVAEVRSGETRTRVEELTARARPRDDDDRYEDEDDDDRYEREDDDDHGYEGYEDDD